MTALVALGVGLGGAVGAVARLLVDGAVSVRTRSSLPLGTLAVNVSGAFLLGVLVGVAPSGDVMRAAGTGLLGGYTTFSTWALESHRLAEDGELPEAAANFAVSLLVGVAGVAAGRALGGLA